MPVNLADATEVGRSSVSQQGPPATLEFAFGGKRLVRYSRMARSGDPDASVLGKGGFGCVYRYAIDASFTPPSSMDLSLSLRSASASASAHRHPSDHDSLPSEGSLNSSLLDHVAPVEPGAKPPSLVAVKLCRTPCSGSFDELQKTSLTDKKVRRAEMRDDRKMHVRIVRGEGRIFQYLQAARHVSSRSTDPPLVKLLANLSPAGNRLDAQLNAIDISMDEEEGPPTRLLVFEKLIEIDAERTVQGWKKSKKTWTHERVEKVAFEIMQGLQFLHEHNVTHGDLKPSNLMLDPRTGVVKLIDLGASRRFVYLSNKERNNRCAVEEQDRRALERNKPVERLAPELCEGLGSLTGSPYYMAPEILLQATRYVDVSGRARSVLEDYEFDYPSFLPREQWPMYQIGLSDLRRGWGIRADIWSWACTVQALLLKTVPEEQRPSSSTISPYDFSFSRHRDEMIDPLYEKSPGEDDVPRFHQWCRVLPLLIVRIALEPLPLVPQADGCSPALRSALKASLRHQDLRPTADEIQEALGAARPSPRSSGRHAQTPNHVSSHSTMHRQVDRSSPAAAPTEASASPQTCASELEGSRYTTPSLSQGASSVSTSQHTCETINKSGLDRTPDRNRKVRFESSTAESGLMPSSSPDCQLSAVMDQEAPDAMPQGFELVSPTRPPKLRPANSGDGLRPATANATLQSVHACLSEQNRASAVSKSLPSTPASSIREATDCVARTSARAETREESCRCEGSELAHHVGAHVSPKAERSWGADGLGISWPLEGMRNLQLADRMPESRRPCENESVPSSPMAHMRGASMPFLGTNEQRGTPLRMPPPVALASSRGTDARDIGGSPRCSTTDGKGFKHSSLMATLKEKQVRLKQGSRRLMGQRAGGVRSTHDSSEGHTCGAREDELGEMGEPVYCNNACAAPTRTAMGGGGGTSSRRTANRTGDDGTPSKPLLRRLFTWSTTS